MIFLLYLYNFVWWLSTDLASCNWSREWITHLPIEEVYNGLDNVEDS